MAISKRALEIYTVIEDLRIKTLEEAINKENMLSIPDIRNKLTPITNMIALFEKGHIDMIKLEEVKKSINYLANREVYELS